MGHACCTTCSYQLRKFPAKHNDFHGAESSSRPSRKCMLFDLRVHALGTRVSVHSYPGFRSAVHQTTRWRFQVGTPAFFMLLRKWLFGLDSGLHPRCRQVDPSGSMGHGDASSLPLRWTFYFFASTLTISSRSRSIISCCPPAHGCGRAMTHDLDRSTTATLFKAPICAVGSCTYPISTCIIY